MTKDEILAKIRMLTGTPETVDLSQAKNESAETLQRDLDTILKLRARSTALIERNHATTPSLKLATLREERAQILSRIRTITRQPHRQAIDSQMHEPTPAKRRLADRILDMVAGFDKKQHDRVKSNFSTKVITAKERRVFTAKYIIDAEQFSAVNARAVSPQGNQVVIDIIKSKPRSRQPSVFIIRSEGKIVQKLGVYQKRRLQSVAKLKLDMKNLETLMGQGAVMTDQAARLFDRIMGAESTTRAAKRSPHEETQNGVGARDDTGIRKNPHTFRQAEVKPTATPPASTSIH